MLKKFSLAALTGILAGAGSLAMTGAPASADGLSINLGVPSVYAQYGDDRYHHDREYRDRYDRYDRYDRWQGDQDRRDRRDRGDRRDWHHDDRGH